MPKTSLSSDNKFHVIFQPTDTKDQIAQKIQNGYLNGRAVTMAMDSLSNASLNVGFKVEADNKISSITIDKTTFNQVRKLSMTPFFLRRFVHHIRMKFSNGYRNDFIAKSNTLAQSYLTAIADPKVSSDKKSGDKIDPPKKPDISFKPPTPLASGEQDLDALRLFEEVPFKFSKKVLGTAKAQPFKGSTISEKELNDLLKAHASVLKEGNMGTHGDAAVNIVAAFRDGNGNTNLGGAGPLIDNDAHLNNEIQLKMKQMMTMISEKEPKEQALWMRRLGPPFKNCNVGRVQFIEKHHAILLSGVNPGFESELLQKVQDFKSFLLERMLLEKFPNQDPLMTPIHLQLPHLTSGYLAEIGKALGLAGYNTAATDKHRYQLPFGEKNQFIAQFKARLQNEFEEFCMAIVTDINNAEGDEGISRTSFSKWYGEKAQNSELSEAFSLYNESKKDFYKKLNPPSDDQDMLIYSYIAPAEVKQVLAMLGYIEQA